MGRFNLKVRIAKEEYWHKRKNKSYRVVARDLQNAKNEQMDKALEWCRENTKRGYAALKTGQFPLIKDPKSINKRLDGLVINGKEKEYCSVLTVDEESQIVDHIKNKNRYVLDTSSFCHPSIRN